LYIFRWVAAAEGKVDDKLPPNKQFLVTRKVPCPNRIKDVETAAQGVKEIEVGDGWVETNDNLKDENQEVFDLDDEAHVVPEKAQEEEEEVVDLDDLDDESNNIFASDKYVVKNDEDLSGLQVNAKMRKYDLSITYDYFH
jgi:ubiquitin-like-conjugating enzyme ATG3